MLQDMRRLALDYLNQELHSDDGDPDVEGWYRHLHATDKARLFPYLVEPGERVPQVYILEQIGRDLLGIQVQDVVSSSSGSGCPASALPFLKPTGSQSAAVGPVLKRTYSRDKGGGPRAKINRTTMQSFRELAQSQNAWGSYFREVLEILDLPRLRLLDDRLIAWGEQYDNPLEAVVSNIGPQSNTVFVAVRVATGELPGEDARYLSYLSDVVLAGDRYTTGETPAALGQTCSLCGVTDAVVYSNGVKGAGVNMVNADREGSFPSVRVDNAWKRYAVCAPCADLLFVFQAHVLKKSARGDRRPLTESVCGAKALIIPALAPTVSLEDSREVQNTIKQYLHELADDVEITEEYLLETLKDVSGILSFTILWATVGQNIEKITGSLTHVLPSRLRSLSRFNSTFPQAIHPLFPEALAKGHYLSPKLNLDILHPLFYRPGPHSKSLNQSANLWRLKRAVAESVYHGQLMESKRWWDEWMVTAQAYWDDAVATKDGYKSLLWAYDRKERHQMSTARWIQRIAQFVWYLQQPEVEVYPMPNQTFEPTLPSLRPYFGRESGIDSKEKAYAFVLGILYGKVMEIQGARGVNVGSNALTWLKRLTLKGDDLPELYVKIREKLLAYEAEANPDIRAVLGELGQLATELGDRIRLDAILTSYYLLLGQSMTTKVLPSRAKKGEQTP